MTTEVNQDLVVKLKSIVTNELPLSQLSDEELHTQIELIVDEQTRGQYFSVSAKVNLVEQVYSSIKIGRAHV